MKQKIPMYLHSSKFLFACSEDNYFTITYHCLLNRTILHTMTEVDICQFHTRHVGICPGFSQRQNSHCFSPFLGISDTWDWACFSTAKTFLLILCGFPQQSTESCSNILKALYHCKTDNWKTLDESLSRDISHLLHLVERALRGLL